jgi:hypothetical protein
MLVIFAFARILGTRQGWRNHQRRAFQPALVPSCSPIFLQNVTRHAVEISRRFGGLDLLALLEPPTHPVEGLVRQALGLQATPPLEDLDQQPSERFVLLRRAVAVEVERSEKLFERLRTQNPVLSA